MEPEVHHLDEIEADVECLMCARTIGQLYGHLWRRLGDQRSPRTIASLSTYRDNEPGARPRPVDPRERFRCRECGGQGFVGEITARTLIGKLAKPHCPIHVNPKTGPGRPPNGCSCQPRRLAA